MGAVTDETNLENCKTHGYNFGNEVKKFYMLLQTCQFPAWNNFVNLF